MDSVEHRASNVEASERVERDLDAFIERQDEKRRASEGERREQEAWQVTARIDDARKRRVLALDWYRYRLEAAERAEHNGAAIAARNRTEAERILREELGGELPSENGHEEESA